jgi:hypothetical protein
LWITNNNGSSSTLDAFNPVPQNPGQSGTLSELWSAPIGDATVYSEPAVNNGTVYVGTKDGTLIGFGLLASSVPQLSGDNVDFTSSIISQPESMTARFTAAEPTTVSGFTQTGSAFSIGLPSLALPAVLSQGQSITVPVTFTPNAAGGLSGVLTANDTGGTVSLGLNGVGLLSTGPVSVSPSEVDFGTQLIGGAVVSEPVTLTNATGSSISITGISDPTLPFS